jgi:ABC-type nitrate/sulfonate/bicarbonate transport system ATPase subunit/ABC-type nitrate/sulfonate/bicarbonate transport system permease component
LLKKGRDLFWVLLGTLALLLFWEGAARVFGSALLLPGPLVTARRFIDMVTTKKFQLSLAESLIRVALGLFIAVPLGIAAGLASGLDRRAGLFLKPLFTVISATPVMAVILIAFLIFGQERTPVFTAFLMVFPVMAANTVEGVRAIDPRYRELMRIYRVSRPDALRFLYIPGIVPFILGGLRSALSQCWKVVVAAEVLVQPLRALGSGMQLAKAHLETPELYAWTGATVLAAALSQGLLSLALKLIAGHHAVRLKDVPRTSDAPRASDVRGTLGRPVASNGERGSLKGGGPAMSSNTAQTVIAAENLSFSFYRPDGGVVPVFERLSFRVGEENPVAILGPSGCGKTTLLRLMAGLLVPGHIEKPRADVFPLPGAFVFQDSRLLPWLTVLENVLLPLREKMDASAARERALRFLELVSLPESASALPEELSGGQKQRVSIARAFAYPAPVLYMDEPFQSLDIPLRRELMDLTESLIDFEPRLVIMVTHDPREAVYLGRRVVVLGKDSGGIVFDEGVDLPRNARSFGSAGGSALAARLLDALGGD